MNRLQKKCLIATAGTHLLLVVILFVGPAFFYSRPKPDDSQVLDVIPSTITDAVLNSGVNHAQPPAPTPIAQPTPPTPAPQQQQPTPTTPPPPVPAPSFVEKVKEFFKPTPKELSPDDTKPVEETKPAKPKKQHEIKINTDLVTRTPKDVATQRQAQNDEREQKRRQTEMAAALNSLSSSFNSATTVEMPGHSSVSYASYASVIRSIYTRAWNPPDSVSNDQANTKVRVTIGSDGSVVSAEIIGPSGDDSVDESVQRTLDRVRTIAPFPEGSTEREKTFIINFNLQAKRMLE